MNQPDARPFLVAARKSASGGVQRFHGTRLETANEEAGDFDQLSEVRAYRRIAASLAAKQK